MLEMSIFFLFFRRKKIYIIYNIYIERIETLTLSFLTLTI